MPPQSAQPHPGKHRIGPGFVLLSVGVIFTLLPLLPGYPLLIAGITLVGRNELLVLPKTRCLLTVVRLKERHEDRALFLPAPVGEAQIVETIIGVNLPNPLRRFCKLINRLSHSCVRSQRDPSSRIAG